MLAPSLGEARPSCSSPVVTTVADAAWARLGDRCSGCVSRQANVLGVFPRARMPQSQFTFFFFFFWQMTSQVLRMTYTFRAKVLELVPTSFFLFSLFLFMALASKQKIALLARTQLHAIIACTAVHARSCRFARKVSRSCTSPCDYEYACLLKNTQKGFVVISAIGKLFLDFVGRAAAPREPTVFLPPSRFSLNDVSTARGATEMRPDQTRPASPDNCNWTKIYTWLTHQRDL